ncbi:uncharacterized protein LOC128214629 [Mya arenaria]|uniref:uncharacterized protein LOC128214629 n=1 Tax=Mya arenaria TaxID=6604 RepID=UPI0022E8B4F0|nr:uncharacterized protein LOC128214629 [Mya arenaria]
MAFGGSSIYKGSDLIHDYSCSKCEENDFNTEAQHFCPECEHYLCDKCVRIHGEYFKKHVVYGRGDIQKWAGFSMDRCDQHGNKLEVHCDDHQELCCHVCVSLNHRLCSSISHLPELTRDFLKTAEFKQLPFLRNLHVFGATERVISKAKKLDGDYVYKGQGSKKYSIRIKNDKGICNIKGICELPSGDLVIADSKNWRLKLLDMKCKVTAHLDLPATTLHLCHTTGSEVAVVTDKTHAIYIITVTRGQLQLSRKLSTEDECNSIAHHQGQLYICSGYALYQCTMDGRMVKVIAEDMRVWWCALSPDGERIYITTFIDNQLITLDKNGQVLSNLEVPELENPSGVCVSPSGHVFVCGYCSNNVVQVDREGRQKLATVARKADGIDRPTSVWFSEHTSSLFVGNGALFNHMNFKLTIFRNKYIHGRLARVAEAVLVAVMSGTISFLIILVYNDFQPMAAEPKFFPVQFFCPDGHYSSTPGLFFQTPEVGAIHLFHDVEGITYSPATLAMYCVVFFMLACWTYGLAIPSGLFIPSLLIWAALGRLFGQCLQILFPHAVWLDSGKYALIGAAAQLGGIVRMTISLTVIIIEATGNITFGLPVMILLMIAKWVGDCFNEGIYDSQIFLQGVPTLGWEPPLMSANIFAREVMSHPTIVFRTQEKVGRIVVILKKEAHNGFSVVEDYDPNSDVEYTSEVHEYTYTLYVTAVENR